MLHRLLATLIIAFWLTMTGMLVVRELYPESRGLNAVSVSHVGHLFFQHQQISDLHVNASGEEVGFIHLQARPLDGSDSRQFDLNGSLTVPQPNGKRHRLGWFGRFRLTSRFDLERFDLDISANTPGELYSISVDCVAKTAGFAHTLANRVVDRTAITLDEKGFGSLLRQLSLDPALLRQFQSAGAQMPKFEFHCQVSSLVLSGERISTYLLTMNAGNQPVFDAHVSQLGQVLKARVPLLGYKLASFKDSQ